jgi:hypothetical protein
MVDATVHQDRPTLRARQQRITSNYNEVRNDPNVAYKCITVVFKASQPAAILRIEGAAAIIHHTVIKKLSKRPCHTGSSRLFAIDCIQALVHE